jgi:hypothetical protein
VDLVPLRKTSLTNRDEGSQDTHNTIIH